MSYDDAIKAVYCDNSLPEYDQLLVKATMLDAIVRYTKMSEYNPDKKVILAIVDGLKEG